MNRPNQPDTAERWRERNGVCFRCNGATALLFLVGRPRRAARGRIEPMTRWGEEGGAELSNVHMTKSQVIHWQ